MMHIIGAMAQFERELIKERVSAGMHGARKRGSKIGRPRAYANADKIRALRTQDIPWRAVAAQLGIGTGTAPRGSEWRCRMTESPLVLNAVLCGVCFLVRAAQPVYQSKHSERLHRGPEGAPPLPSPDLFDSLGRYGDSMVCCRSTDEGETRKSVL